MRISRGAPRFDRAPSASLTAYTTGVFKNFVASYHAAVAAGAYDAKESVLELSDLSELSSLTESDLSDDDSSEDLPLALVASRIKPEPIEETLEDSEMAPPLQAPQDGGVAVPESPTKSLAVEAAQLQPSVAPAPAVVVPPSLPSAASPKLDSPPPHTTPPAPTPPDDDEVPMDLDSEVEAEVRPLVEQRISSPPPAADTPAATESLSQPPPSITIEPAPSLELLSSASEPARTVSRGSESAELEVLSEPRPPELVASALVDVPPVEPMLAGSTASPPSPVPSSLQPVAHHYVIPVISAPVDAQSPLEPPPVAGLGTSNSAEAAPAVDSEPPASELEPTTEPATKLPAVDEAAPSSALAPPDSPPPASLEPLAFSAESVDAILQDSTLPAAPVTIEEPAEVAVIDATSAAELTSRRSSPPRGPAAVLVDLPPTVAVASTARDRMHIDVASPKVAPAVQVELMRVKAEDEDERVPAPLAPHPVRLNARGRPSSSSIWDLLAPISIEGPSRPIVDGAPKPVPELLARLPPPPPPTALLSHPEVCAALFFEQMDAMFEQAGPRRGSLCYPGCGGL